VTIRRILTAAAAATLLAVLSACSLFSSDEGDRNAEGEITAASEVDAFSLKVGDCFLQADLAESITSVPALPCSELHDAEIIGKFTSSAPDEFDETSIRKEADDECAAAIETYVGPGWVNAGMNLAWSYFYPDTASWSSGKHTVLCFALTYDMTVSLDASVKGIGN
jgi:hypothetical protein